MRIHEIIGEDYIGMKESFKQKYPIFKNPSKSELKDLIDSCQNGSRCVSSLRFIINKNNDIYFFNSELLHGQAIQFLNLKDTNNDIARGIANINKDKTLSITELYDQHDISIFCKYFTNCADYNLVKEEYVGMKEWNKGHYPIFKNPSKSELKDLIDTSKKQSKYAELRFVYNPNTDEIYFSSSEILHNQTMRFLELDDISNDMVIGVAHINPDKSLTITEIMIPAIITKWDNLNKYFDNCGKFVNKKGSF